MTLKTPQNLIEINEKDLFKCGKVLADAFQNYPLFYEFLGREKYSIEQASKVFMTIITSAGENTHTYLHKSGKGVCSFTEANESNNDIFTIVKSLKWSLQYILSHPSSLMNLLGFNSYCLKLRKEAGYTKAWYLFLLGVEHSFQHQGVARDMLMPFFEYFDETSQICYLETCSDSDMCFYEKLGFDVVAKSSYGKWKIPVIAMVRKPKNNS